MTKHNSTEVRKKQNKHVKLPCFETTTVLEEKAGKKDQTEGAFKEKRLVYDLQRTGG